MIFYQPAGGGGGASGTVNILIQINAQLAQLNQAVQGLQQLQNTTVSVSTASAASIGLFTTAFEKLADGVVAATTKAADVFKNFIEDTISMAAKIQTEQFPLITVLKDSGVAAETILGNLHSLWQQIGVISSESLGQAARDLSLLGTPAENLSARIIEVGKAAVATGVNITSIVGAYQRVAQAIRNETEPMVRGTGEFGNATNAVFLALEHHFGIIGKNAEDAKGQMLAMFTAGKVTINDLNMALREAADTGGIFFDAFERKQATFDGAVQAMKTAWQGFQFEIGKPIIDFLTPIINKITLIGQEFQKIAAERGWQDTLKLAWSILIDEVMLAWAKAWAALWTTVIPATIAAWHAAWEAINNILKQGLTALSNENMKKMAAEAAAAFSKTFADTLIGNMDSDLKAKKGDLEAALAGLLAPGTAAGGQVLLPGETEEMTTRARAAKELSTALHELEMAMNAIRQEQKLISEAPFMGMDEKRLESIKAYEKELANLTYQIDNLRKQKELPGLNEAQLAQINNQLQTAGNRVLDIQQKILGMEAPIRASLQRWADSFGTTFDQIGKTIEESVNTALNSLNEFLVTGKFNAQQLLQEIIKLGLQLIEHLAIQRVMMMINAGEASAQAAITGPAIAASMAPAATAQTIATFGAAAAQAPGAVAAALAGIEAILVAHEGGTIGSGLRRWHDGGLSHDEVPIIAQEGEIMIRRSVAQAPGMASFLLGLNSMAFHEGGKIPRFHPGGQIPVWNWVNNTWEMPTSGGGGGAGEITTALQGIGSPSGIPGSGGPLWSPWPSWLASQQVITTDPSGAGLVTSTLGDIPIPGSSTFSTTTAGVHTSYLNASTLAYQPIPISVSSLSAPSWMSSPSSYSGMTGLYGFGGSSYSFGGAFGIGTGGFGILSSGIGGGGGFVGAHPKYLHFGGPVRFQGGGQIRGGSASGRGAAGLLGGVHIYAFTDLKALTRHMSSREGQKIIFDTVKGRSIDLGI